MGGKEDADAFVEVVPTNRVRGETSVHEYEYTFTEAHVDEVERLDPDGVNIQRVEGGLRWQYEGEVPVWVESFGVFARKNDDITQAEEQAYYAVSILASNGYVTRWRQK